MKKLGMYSFLLLITLLSSLIMAQQIVPKYETASQAGQQMPLFWEISESGSFSANLNGLALQLTSEGLSCIKNGETQTILPLASKSLAKPSAFPVTCYQKGAIQTKDFARQVQTSDQAFSFAFTSDHKLEITLKGDTAKKFSPDNLAKIDSYISTIDNLSYTITTTKEGSKLTMQYIPPFEGEGAYYGGNNKDTFVKITETSTGIIAAGITRSTDIPFDTAKTDNTNWDIFFIEFSPDFYSIHRGMVIPGAGNDYITDSELISTNELLFCGFSYSADMPVTNATALNSFSDGILGKLNLETWELDHLGYIGGNSADGINTMFIDQTTIYLGGISFSNAFPQSVAANASFDMITGNFWITAVDPATYTPAEHMVLGGAQADNIYDLFRKGATLYFTGYTLSETITGAQNTNHGQQDACVGVLDNNLALQDFRFLGNTSDDNGDCIYVSDTFVQIAGNAQSDGVGSIYTPLDYSNLFFCNLSLSDLSTVNQAVYGGDQNSMMYDCVQFGDGFIFAGITYATNFSGYAVPSPASGDFLTGFVNNNLQLINASVYGGAGKDTLLTITQGATHLYYGGTTQSDNFEVAGLKTVSGETDGYIDRVSVKYLEGPILDDVTDFYLLPVDQGIQLHWTEPAFDGYNGVRVYTKTGPSEYTLAAQLPVGGTQYAITGLTNGAEYDVKVVTINGDPRESIGVTAKVTPGSTPPDLEEITNLQVAVTSQTLQLFWTNPPTSTYEGIRVYLKEGNGAFRLYRTLGTDVSTLTIPGLENNVEYTVLLKTFDSLKRISDGATITATPDFDQEAPADVSNLVVTSGNTMLNALWTNPADIDLDAIRVYISPDAVNYTQVATLEKTVTTYTFTDLTNLHPYTVRITTVDASGNESSGAYAAGTPGLDTNPPADVTNARLSEQVSSLLIEWTNPLDDDFIGCLLYTSLDGVTYSPFAATNTDANMLEVPKPFTIAFRYIKICTVDTSANQSQGVVLDLGVDTTPPMEVTLITPAIRSKEIQLNWINPIDGDYSGCEIYVGLQAGSLTLTQTVLKPATTFTVGGLTPLTTYYFMIKTFDMNGNKSQGITASYSTSNSTIKGFYLGGYENTMTSKKGLASDEYIVTVKKSPTGQVWVLGSSSGEGNGELPVADDPMQWSNAGGADLWIGCYDETMENLLYGTYFGGTGDDWGYDLNFNEYGNVIIVGETQSTDLPGQIVTQPLNGDSDGFYLVLAPELPDAYKAGKSQSYDNRYTALVGGEGKDSITSIIKDDSNIYLIMTTDSSVIAGTQTPFEAPHGNKDIAILEFDPLYFGLMQTTFWGGAGNDVSIQAHLSDSYIGICGYSESNDLTNLSRVTAGAQPNGFITLINRQSLSVYRTILIGGNDSVEIEEYPEERVTDFFFATGNTIKGVGISNCEEIQPNTGAISTPDLFLFDYAMDSDQLTSLQMINGSSYEAGAQIEPLDNGQYVIAFNTDSPELPVFGQNYYVQQYNNLDDIYYSVYDQYNVPMTGGYLGGSEADMLSSLLFDGQKLIFGGATTSPDFFALGELIGPNYLGGEDGFYAEIGLSIPNTAAQSWQIYQ